MLCEFVLTNSEEVDDHHKMQQSGLNNLSVPYNDQAVLTILCALQVHLYNIIIKCSCKLTKLEEQLIVYACYYEKPIQ